MKKKLCLKAGTIGSPKISKSCNGISLSFFFFRLGHGWGSKNHLRGNYCPLCISLHISSHEIGKLPALAINIIVN